MVSSPSWMEIGAWRRSCPSTGTLRVENVLSRLRLWHASRKMTVYICYSVGLQSTDIDGTEQFYIVAYRSTMWIASLRYNSHSLKTFGWQPKACLFVQWRTPASP